MAILRLTILLILLVPAPTDRDDDARIRGGWRVVRAEANDGGRPVDEVVRQFKGGQWVADDRVLHSLDPGKSPKHIDFKLNADKGSPKRYGIYELNGNWLGICFSTDVSREFNRPTDFTTPPSSSRALVVFERAKGAPPSPPLPPPAGPELLPPPARRRRQLGNSRTIGPSGRSIRAVGRQLLRDHRSQGRPVLQPGQRLPADDDHRHTGDAHVLVGVPNSLAVDVPIVPRAQRLTHLRL